MRLTRASPSSSSLTKYSSSSLSSVDTNSRARLLSTMSSDSSVTKTIQRLKSMSATRKLASIRLSSRMKGKIGDDINESR